MFISNRSRKGNIIGLARLTTENYNRYLKKLLICIPLMIISLICWDLFTSIYLSIFYSFASYLKYHFVISCFLKHARKYQNGTPKVINKVLI